MLRWSILALGLVVVLVVGLLTSHDCRCPLDERTADVLRGATRVEVLRLSGSSLPRDLKPDEEQIGGFRVVSHGKDQGSTFAGKLADVMLDPRTHVSASTMCFAPGIAFRIWRGDATVDIIICFHCENFYCGPPTTMAHENGNFSGSPNKRRLIELAKEAFPDDKQIQELKE